MTPTWERARASKKGKGVTRRIRQRFWAEAVVAVASAILLVITLMWNDWIELVFKIDPDDNNGAAEWLIVVFVVTISVVSLTLARYEWRRAVAQPI